MPEKIDTAWIDPGFTNGNFTHSIASAVKDMEYFGCAGRIFRASTSIPLRSRNMVVEEFLQDSNNPWLWLVDADMVFDKGHVMKLWNCASDNDVKMVSGLAFIFKHSGKPVPSFYLPGSEIDGFVDGDLVNMPGWIPDEAIPVAATGLASSLIHRDVFEAMPYERQESYRWFDFHRTSLTGELLGEDMQFFVRAKELGFQLWFEPDATTWHVKEIGVGLRDWKHAWGKDEEE
jgi:GT2 family glycosyltransferase